MGSSSSMSASLLSSTSSGSSRNESTPSYTSGSISIEGLVVGFEAVSGSFACTSTSKFGSSVIRSTAAVACVVNDVSHLSCIGLSIVIIPHSLRKTYRFHQQEVYLNASRNTSTKSCNSCSV